MFNGQVMKFIFLLIVLQDSRNDIKMLYIALASNFFQTLIIIYHVDITFFFIFSIGKFPKILRERYHCGKWFHSFVLFIWA